MKLVLSLTLPILIFAFITNFSLGFSNDEQVLDTNGNPVIPGGEYYIFPATELTGKGGLRLAKTDDYSKCPVTVLQNVNVTGLPVKFTIVGISNGAIFTGTKLDIEFSKKPNCAYSSKWYMVLSLHLPIFYVGLDVPDKDPDLAGGTFNIQKYGNAYKLGYCDGSDCTEIVRWNNNNNKEGGSRLIWNKTEPNYPVVFVDAPSFESGILMDVRL